MSRNAEQNNIDSKDRYYIAHEDEVATRESFACDPGLTTQECDQKFSLLRQCVINAKLKNPIYYENNCVLNEFKKQINNETNTKNLKEKYGDSLIDQLETNDFKNSASMKSMRQHLFPERVFPNAPSHIYPENQNFPENPVEAPAPNFVG